MWLFLTELAGIVLTAYGVSLWSVPSAIILGGLVLVAVVEVRPKKMPALPLPEAKLREQVELAARVINVARFGVGDVDPGALGKMSLSDCEHVIVAARSMGANKT